MRPCPGFLASLSLACLAASGLFVRAADAEGAAKEDPDDYIRFVEDDARGRLQTAVVHYTHPGGVSLDLIGVVHIGDKAYFQALNESFKAYDALLFEMVGADPGKPLTKEDLQKNKKNPLRFFQLLIAGMMDLDFQLDGIDYAAPNFVHADMDMETFLRRQDEKGENLLGLVEKGFTAQQAAAAGGEDTFDFAEMFKLFGDGATPAGNKLSLGRQYHNIEGMFAGMEGPEGSVLVGERNLAALKVLQREMAAGKKKLGIFYGAAHLPDFDKRLRDDLGFKRRDVTWLTAWDIDKADAAPAADAEGDADSKEDAAEPAAEAEPKKAA